MLLHIFAKPVKTHEYQYFFCGGGDPGGRGYKEDRNVLLCVARIECVLRKIRYKIKIGICFFQSTDKIVHLTGLLQVSGLLREPVVSVKNPTLISHLTEKRTPTLSWQTPTLSLRVLCGCSGSSRRLQVPYVIPRPGGVPRQLYGVCCFS